MDQDAQRPDDVNLRAGSRGAPALRLSPTGVVFGAVTTLAPVLLLDLAVTGRLSLLTEVWFVLVCAASALVAARSAFFTVGVLPPLLMLGTLSLLTMLDPAAVTADHLAFPSTVLTGLALHAGALIAGHATALGIIARRHVVAQPDTVRRRVSGSPARRP